MNYTKYIEDNIKDIDVSYRGGYIKVNITGLLSDESIEAIEEAGEEAIAGARQNYLGGGIAGAITSGRSFDDALLTESDYKIYIEFIEAVKKYFYELNQGGGDEYMIENINSFEQNQKLPVSGY